MDFYSLVRSRQSDRGYIDKAVEDEKITRILECARLAPSACNGQPYKITVCRGEVAKSVLSATGGKGINGFATTAPVAVVISEDKYVPTAALGAKVKHNDYRSIDIGILAAYITAAAEEEGLGSCILGWFDDDKIREVCSLTKQVRLVITLGYPKNEEKRLKKRKNISELVDFLG
jgi:nitroreductase